MSKNVDEYIATSFPIISQTIHNVSFVICRLKGLIQNISFVG